MRSIVLPLVWLFAVAGLAMAQMELADFVQEGRATWEMADDGLHAAHPSLPIGSRPTVRNVTTGLETEVTITGRIPLSSSRVIDISPAAAAAIGLEAEGNVLVYFPVPAVPGPERELPLGVNVTINNYVIPRSALPELLERSLAAAAGGHVFVNHVPIMPTEAMQSEGIQPRVTPGLPDPDGSGVYDILVGTWQDTGGAIRAFRQLQAAGLGFDAVLGYDRGENEYLVAVGDIPASDVYLIVRRLGEMGFNDLYIE